MTLPTHPLWTLVKGQRQLRLTEQPVVGGHMVVLYEGDELLHSGLVRNGEVPLIRDQWRAWFEGAGWHLPCEQVRAA